MICCDDRLCNLFCIIMIPETLSIEGVDQGFLDSEWTFAYSCTSMTGQYHSHTEAQTVGFVKFPPEMHRKYH